MSIVRSLHEALAPPQIEVPHRLRSYRLALVRQLRGRAAGRIRADDNRESDRPALYLSSGATQSSLPLVAGHVRQHASRHTEKYFACGWVTTIAEVDCSGSSWSSSVSTRPISSARSSWRSCFWSPRLGQAG